MMKEQKEYRKYIIGLFVLGVVFIFLSSIAFWNAFTRGSESLGIAPVLYSILAGATFSAMLYFTLKATDRKIFQQIIDEKIGEEKSKIFADLNKEEIEEVRDEEEEYVKLAQNLIPSESFNDIESLGKKMLIILMNELNGVQGIIYKRTGTSDRFEFVAGYGLTNEEPIPSFVLEEGLNGEAAHSGEIMFINEIPENYFHVESGLGSGEIGGLALIPIVHDGQTIGLIEFASFKPLTDKTCKILNEYSNQASNKFHQLISA